MHASAVAAIFADAVRSPRKMRRWCFRLRRLMPQASCVC
jgi:hypothetical protein